MSAAFDEIGNGSEVIAPLPRVSIQVFTETDDVTAAIQQSCQDRRMSKAHVKIQTGGAAAAVEAYRNAPTPNVIIIESRASATNLLGHLDELAGECDEGTKVLIIGHANDVLLYRELLRRGVSDYLITPLRPLDLVRSLSEQFGQATGHAVGKTIAVVGAKGGVGSSTIAHNLAFSIVREVDIATCIVDFDLAWGTAGLDFNIDPISGIIDAISEPDRVDATMIDRLIAPCGEKLSLLAAPATLERTYDFPFRNYEPVIDILRNAAPFIVYDMPHVWSDWNKQVLMTADEIVIVAEPDLGNLRNAKNLNDSLLAMRKHDAKPLLVLNKVGIPKRPEISVAEFAAAFDTDPLAAVPFDPQLFGTAANNGQMLSEVQANHKASEVFPGIVQAVTGKAEKAPRSKGKSAVAMLEPLLSKLKLKRG